MKFKVNDIVETDRKSFLGIVESKNKDVIAVKVIKNDGEFIVDEGVAYFYDDAYFIKIKEFNSEQERLAFILKHG